jgi:hypothetical protein
MHPGEVPTPIGFGRSCEEGLRFSLISVLIWLMRYMLLLFFFVTIVSAMGQADVDEGSVRPTFYVNPKGTKADDNNPGTSQTLPLKSLQQAIDRSVGISTRIVVLTPRDSKLSGDAGTLRSSGSKRSATTPRGSGLTGTTGPLRSGAACSSPTRSPESITKQTRTDSC